MQERRSILVVDGSASFVFYTAMMLKKLDYAVQSASTVEGALAVIARSAPAVVITDTVLPGTTGVELLKRIKNNDSLRFIPVIVHSAEVDPGVKEDCTRAGCAAFFCKPAEPEALFRAIQSATEATPRRNIRIKTSLKALIGGGPGAGGTEQVIQLSEGGAYVATPMPAPAHAALPLTLFIKNREIRVMSVVLYSSTTAGGRFPVPGMGLQFTSIDSADLAFVREYIHKQVMSDIGGIGGGRL
jgi:two-component system, chemotaxis family, chemotaxis protein CheY